VAEYTNSYTGYIFAPAGLFPVADELEKREWPARARHNTINPEEEHLEIEGEILRLTTRPLKGNTHMIYGQVVLSSPEGDAAFQKLAEDFEAIGVFYALKLHDEAGAEVIREFGGGSPLDFADLPVPKGQGGKTGGGGSCALLLAAVLLSAAAALMLLLRL
jgi:hypothetical protein